MPLYDFACGACGKASTLLLKRHGDPAVCPACGSDRMQRQMAPCAFTGFAKAGASAAPAAAPSAGHVHSASCGCAGASADQLIKKYLD
jgi:putative FmdB family regulatory protein